MAADPDILSCLNDALKNQLTCINQCFLHARMLKHQGHVQSADTEYKESIDAMKHSDMLVEHILSVGGLPNLQELGQLLVGDTYPNMVAYDLQLKEITARQLKTAIETCERHSDGASAQLLGRILANIEEHIVYLRRKIDAEPHAA